MRDLFPHLGPEPVTDHDVKPDKVMVRDVAYDDPKAKEAAFWLALRLVFPDTVPGGWTCGECLGHGRHVGDCPKRLRASEPTTRLGEFLQ